MKKLINVLVLTFSVLLFLNCKSQSKVRNFQNTSEKEIYDIVNFILLKGPFQSHVVVNECKSFTLDESDKAVLLSLDGIITKEGVDYLAEQTKDTSTFTLQNSKLDNSILVIDSSEVEKDIKTFEESKKYWEAIFEKYPDSYTTLSKPILTADKNILLIRFSKYCGSLCGTGGIMVFVKKGNEWDLRAITSSWDS